MPAVSGLRCPECNAALAPPAPGLHQSKCAYCGVVSRIPENRTEQIKAVLQSVVQKPKQPVAKPATWIILLILAPFVLPFVFGILITIIGIIVAIVAGEPLARAVATSSAALANEKMQWSGQHAAMLLDVNRDGVADPIGRVNFVTADAQPTHLAAFDALTAERLWMSEPIGTMSTGHEVKTALVGETLLIADSTGVLKALSPYTGQQLWTSPLGERAEWLCGYGPGQASVELADKRILNVQLATGQVSPGGQGDDSQPCLGAWSDKPGLTPSMRVEGWLMRPRRDMPQLSGLEVEKLVRDIPSGTVVALGYKTPGTRIPAAASLREVAPTLEARGGKKRPSRRERQSPPQVLWLSQIPASSPLSVAEGGPDTGAIAMGRLLVPYEMNGSPSLERLACLDLATGRSLWDVEIPQSDTGDAAAVVANDRLVFVSIWTYLHIFDLATGAHRATIGKWM
jgi:hypothetical protein